MQKTITVDDKQYVLETMTAGDGLAIQESLEAEGKRAGSGAFAMQVVAASLRWPIDQVKEMPWPHYLALIPASLDINGLKQEEKSAEGEAQAGESPAA